MRTATGRVVVALFFILAASLPIMAAAPTQTTEEDVVSALVFPIKNAKVVDTITQGLVVYAAIEVPSSETVWISAPVCEIKVGDTISVPEGTYYPNVLYTSLAITFRNLVIPSKLLLNGKDQKVFPDQTLPQFCVIGR